MTEEIAEEAGMTVDREGFEAAMKEQQERARASVVKGGSMGMQNETLQNITAESHFNYEKRLYLRSWLRLWQLTKKLKKFQLGRLTLFFRDTILC